LNAQEQNPDCRYNIQEALFYLKGSTSIEKDTLKAIEYLKPCASIGNEQAQLVLGHLYVNDSDALIVREGFKLIKASAKEDNPIAAQKLGFLYKYGIGCRLNYQKAIKWFQKAYELGNDEGAYSLGYFYLKGLGDIPQDYTKAVHWFKKSKSDMANYWLGVCYLNGDGVAKDLTRAYELLGTDYQEEQAESTKLDEMTSTNTGIVNSIENLEQNTNEGLNGTQLNGKWTGVLLKKDWSKSRVEHNIPMSLTISYSTEEGQTNYTWEIEGKAIKGSALFVDKSIYFDLLQVNLPHNSYHEKIPSSVGYQILSSNLSIVPLENKRYLIGNLESYITDWDEKGEPMTFVLAEENSPTENGEAISQEILEALTGQKEHFIKLYPNPFVSDLIIAYTLENAGNTKIQVSSFDGMQNYTIHEEHKQEAGDYRYYFEGDSLKKGIYIVSIYVDGIKKTRLIIKK
jgi:hypothetical protein